MKEEPFFIVNDFLEEDLPELNKIMHTINGPKIKDLERAVFLRNFTNHMFNAYRKQKFENKFAKESYEKRTEKLKLERKKQELLEKLDKIKEIKEKEKPIIFSEFSKQALVKTSFTGSSYLVSEPLLTKEDSKFLNSLNIDSNLLENIQELKLKIKQEAEKNNLNFTDEFFDKIRYYLVRDIKNYGKLSPLIEDKKITEISCNDLTVLIHYEGKEIPTNVKFSSDNELNDFIVSMAKKNNQEINKENPFINFKLKDFEFQGTLKTEFMKPRFVLIKVV